MQKRIATMQLDRAEGPATLRVEVPRDVNAGELANLNKSIVDVIRNHTGCSCLSGRISVLLESEWQEAVEVNLEARSAAQ